MICGALFAAFCLTNPVFYDGDTPKDRAPWGTQRYRLDGVKAPELNEPGGKESRNYATALVGGEDLACDNTTSPSFDRFVVDCWLPDGRLLNCILIESEHATVDPRYPRDDCED